MLVFLNWVYETNYAFFIAFLAMAGTNSPTKTSGLVKDVKGKPIHGVGITLLQTYDGVVTDRQSGTIFVPNFQKRR